MLNRFHGRTTRNFSSIAQILHHSLQRGDLRSIKRLHAHLLRTNLLSVSLCIHSQLIFTYITKFNINNPEIFTNGMKFMKFTGPTAFNLLLSDFCRNGFPLYALKTLHFMHANEISLDTYSLCNSLTASISIGNVDLGKQFHAFVKKSGWSSSVFVGSSLISFYSKLLFISDAQTMFDEIPVKNIVCANALLSGYGEAKLWLKGLDLARKLTTLNLGYDNFTFSAMLRACAGLAAIEFGKQLHAFLIRSICELGKDVFLQTSLIEMYGKCGLAEKARFVFDLVGLEMVSEKRRDIVLWTSMLGAYGKNGHFEKVIELYGEMLGNDIRPDGVAFVTVISACVHTGQVKLGIKYFESMGHDFNLEPGPEHFSCLIDLLCRAGELDKSLKLIDDLLKRGFVGAVSMWGAVLSSCEDRGNIQLGILAAQKGLDLEPENVGIYTKLSNLYARLAMWDEIDQLRRTMNQRGLKKDTAHSIIQISC